MKLQKARTDSLKDLQRDIQSGDQNWADLDSAVLAADIGNLGSDEAALWVWEGLQ